MAKRSPGSPLPLDRALESLLWASLHRSRRAILDRRVVVNGTVLTDPAHVVDPVRDDIVVDGEPLSTGAARVVTLIMHKPAGMPAVPTTDVIDLFDLLPIREGWFAPCGTLTGEQAGLVILTTDTDHADAESSPWSTLTSETAQLHGVPTRVRLGPFLISELDEGSWQRLTGDLVAALDALVASGIDHRTPLDAVWDEIARAAREHEGGG